MEILEVTSKEYSSVIQHPYVVFNSVGFNELNSAKCEDVKYLLFKQNKFKLGIVGGVRGNCFLSPFSAPFGGFATITDDVDFEFLNSAIIELEKYLASKGINEIKIVLPPVIYNDNFISKQVNTFFRHNYSIKNIDINYHFDLDFFNHNYLANIKHNARKNFNVSLKHDLMFIKCNLHELKVEAYDIIKLNREERGFPLRMTKDQVFETAKIIPADFFLIKHQNFNIAAAIVFEVAERIKQVIYWGDNPKYSHLKPMNFLSYKLFEYYSQNKCNIVDIGPSTEDSIPNYGLCSFKESIGCLLSQKITFTKKIQ